MGVKSADWINAASREVDRDEIGGGCRERGAVIFSPDFVQTA